jgi:branched-chain amino acid transport system substrate-binding protein
MPVLNNAGLLMISPANTAIGLTKKNPDNPDEPEKYRPTGKINYTRIVPTDDLQGPLGADWAKELGVKRVAVLDDRTVYGRGIARLFARHCAEIGVEVVGTDSVDPKSSLDFRALMSRLKTKEPDMLYFGGTTTNKAGQLVKDMLAVGLDIKFMVPDGCMEPAFITAADAKNLNGRCYATFGGLTADAFDGADEKFLAAHKSQKDFIDRYKQQFHKDPEPYAVYGYEAAKVALEAIRRAGKKDRAAIVAACLGIKDFHGALGTWSFDKNGDTDRTQLCGYEVENGKFRFVKELGK